MKTTNITIQQETPSEYSITENLTREAFWNVYTPGCCEHYILRNLRTSPDFIAELSLTAKIEGKIVAHIAYSHCHILHHNNTQTPALCFGPLSVLPEYQNQGIAAQLITHSLRLATKIGHKIVCISGNPHYYRRFGFRTAERYDLTNAEGQYAACMMAKELLPDALKDKGGRVIESPVFAELNEKDFEQYEDTFPKKIKEQTASQTLFQFQLSMTYKY